MPSALDIAHRIVLSNLRENPPSSNRAPLIDKMLKSAGTIVGLPWCAAFVSWCFRQASGNIPNFNSASSQLIRRWFENRGWLSFDPQDLLRRKGALFGWTNPDRAHGHIGFVQKRFTKLGRVVSLGTLEGNTNRSMERNGDGAYALHRSIAAMDDKPLWFLNTSEIEGGRWWLTLRQ